MAVYTIDASVHLSALNPAERHSAASQAFLALVQRRQIAICSPTLLPVEVAAAVSRALGDTERGLALAAAVRDLPNQTLVPLDAVLADRAAGLAAQTRVRGADAVYGAVAQQYETVLVTVDRQQLERLSPEVQTAQPEELLAGT